MPLTSLGRWCVFLLLPLLLFLVGLHRGSITTVLGGFERIPEGISGPEDDWKDVFSAEDCGSLGAIGR